MTSRTAHPDWATPKNRPRQAGVRTSLGADEIAQAVVENLRCLQGKLPQQATRHDWYVALAYSVRDRMLDRSLTTVEGRADAPVDTKLVAYLSAEFLTRPHLGNSLIAGGFFSNGDRDLFRPLVDSLLTRDDYMLLADYQAYVDCQQRVSEAYRNQDNWTRMSILNAARVGRFSSDRSIREYCRDIWDVSPMRTDRSES